MVQEPAQRVHDPRHLRGLAALHNQQPGYADHQQRREGEAVSRQLQLLRVGRRVEGPSRTVPRLRGPRGRDGRRRHGLRAQVRRPRRELADDGDGRGEHHCEFAGWA